MPGKAAAPGRPSGTPLATAGGVASPGLLHQLFLLNVSLQLFDGVASYYGVPCWGEGNPLVYEAMAALGIGPALLLYKAKACGFLVLVRQLSDPGATVAVYVLVAVAYGVLSFVPWLVRLGSLLVA